jgi:hypothetical protein
MRAVLMTRTPVARPRFVARRSVTEPPNHEDGGVPRAHARAKRVWFPTAGRLGERPVKP